MELKKEGQAGQRKITTYTRNGTVVLATIQAFFTSLALQSQGIAITGGVQFMVISIVSLVTGAVFLMWLGEQITERGIGNGISLLILGSIIAGLPRMAFVTSSVLCVRLLSTKHANNVDVRCMQVKPHICRLK